MLRDGIGTLLLLVATLAGLGSGSVLGQLVESPPPPTLTPALVPLAPSGETTDRTEDRSPSEPTVGLSIGGPDSVPAFHLGRFAAPTGSESAAWLVMPTGSADVESLDGGQQLIVAAPPGPYTLIVVSMAGGHPTIATKDIVFLPPTDGGGAQPPPDDGSAPLQKEIEVASREYLRGIPKVLRKAADDVASGKIATVDALRDAIAAGRQASAVPLSGRLAVQWQGAIGGDGTIIDKAKIQQSLINSAKAMEAGLR